VGLMVARLPGNGEAASVSALVGISLGPLIDTYGCLALFALVGLESVGIPLPGETALITAAVYAGSTHRLDIVLVITVAAGAAIVGDNIGFMLGRTGGAGLLERYGRYVRFDERRMKIGRYIFLQHGGKVVFFGRFVSVMRTYAAFLAGVNRMRWRRFLFFNASGGIVWALVFGLGYYYLADVITRFRAGVDIGLAAIAVLVIVASLVYLHRFEDRLAERAERALSEPGGG
jgi:membrane protein DedA with SNARE-associated domain